MTQLPMFSPTQAGEQPVESLQARLLARRTDPETSKAAARRVQPNTSLALFLSLLEQYGPLTHKEAAAFTPRRDYFATEFDKRVKTWNVAGHIELTGEVRNGARVWARTDREEAA